MSRGQVGQRLYEAAIVVFFVGDWGFATNHAPDEPCRTFSSRNRRAVERLGPAGPFLFFVGIHAAAEVYRAHIMRPRIVWRGFPTDRSRNSRVSP